MMTDMHSLRQHKVQIFAPTSVDNSNYTNILITVKSFLFLGQLISCILWVEQSTNKIPPTYYSLQLYCVSFESHVLKCPQTCSLSSNHKISCPRNEMIAQYTATHWLGAVVRGQGQTRQSLGVPDVASPQKPALHLSQRSPSVLCRHSWKPQQPDIRNTETSKLYYYSKVCL